MPDSIPHTDGAPGYDSYYQEEPPRYHQEYEGHDAYSDSDSDQEPSPYLDVYNQQELPEPDASEQATYA
jgi:hypothetical protein